MPGCHGHESSALCSLCPGAQPGAGLSVPLLGTEKALCRWVQLL